MRVILGVVNMNKEELDAYSLGYWDCANVIRFFAKKMLNNEGVSIDGSNVLRMVIQETDRLIDMCNNKTQETERLG